MRLFRNSRYSVSVLCLLVSFLFPLKAEAQSDPALQTAVAELIESYLKVGPRKSELDNGSALANWALLKDVALPQLLSDGSLHKGEWGSLNRPLRATLDKRGFEKLRPLEVLTLWEETRSQPDRFVRLLGRKKILNPKEPAERNKGRELRLAIGEVRAAIPSVRSTSRFEKVGWKYTATSVLSLSERFVRVAIQGSQTCKISGRAKTVNLTLKGRLFEAPDSSSGIKVQVLDKEMLSKGCELNLRDRIDTVQHLADGGESKLAGNLNMNIRDDIVSGRFQADIVSKQAGKALLTGRAIYALRGRVSKDGRLNVELLSISSSGSKVLRRQLEKSGRLTGMITNSTGKGKIMLGVLKDPLVWQDARTKNNRSRKRPKKRR